MARRLQNIGQVVAEGRVGKMAMGVGEHNEVLKVQAAFEESGKAACTFPKTVCRLLFYLHRINRAVYGFSVWL